jgi:hypothetical protein
MLRLRISLALHQRQGEQRDRARAWIQRIVSKMMHARAAQGFQRWRQNDDAIVRAQAHMKKAVKQMVKKRITRSWNKWVVFSKDSRSTRQRLRRTVAYLQRSKKVSAWNAWLHFVSRQRHTRNVLQTMERRQSARKLYRQRELLFKRWTKWRRDVVLHGRIMDINQQHRAKEMERRRRLLERITKRCEKTAYWVGFRAWQAQARRGKAMFDFCERVAQSSQRRLQSASFRYWQSTVAAAIQQGTSLKRAAMRLKMLRVAQCMDTWGTFVQRRQHLRNLVRRRQRAVVRSKLARGLRCWQRGLNRLAVATSVMQLKAKDAEYETRRHEWEAAEKQALTERAFRIMSKCLRQCISSRLSVAWQHWAFVFLPQSRRKEKNVVRALNMWRRQALQKSLYRWSGNCADAKHNRLCARRAFGFMIRHLLEETWRAWISLCERRRSARKIVSRLENTSLRYMHNITRTAFVLWERQMSRARLMIRMGEERERQLQEIQSFRLLRIERIVSRLQKRDISNAFDAWAEFTNGKRVQARHIARTIAKVWRRARASGFLRWSQWVLRRVGTRHFLRRKSSEWRQAHLSCALELWWDEVERSKVLCSRRTQIARRFAHRNMLAAFHGWAHAVETQRRTRENLKTLVFRINFSLSAKAMTTWCYFVYRRQTVRRFVRRYVTNFRRRNLEAGFRQWSRIKTANSIKEAMMRATEDFHKAAREFQQYRTKINRDKALMGWRHCFQRADLRRVSRGFLQWKRAILREAWEDKSALNRRRQMLANIIHRISRIQKTMAFRQWCAVIDTRKRAEMRYQRASRMWVHHTSTTAFQRWREWSYEVFRLRGISTKICRRLSLRKAALVLDSWRNFIERRVVVRRLVLRRVRLWTRQRLTTTVQLWRAECLRLRGKARHTGLLGKAAVHLRRVRLVSAFNAWFHLMHTMIERRYVNDLLTAEARLQHDLLKNMSRTLLRHGGKLADAFDRWFSRVLFYRRQDQQRHRAIKKYEYTSAYRCLRGWKKYCRLQRCIVQSLGRASERRQHHQKWKVFSIWAARGGKIKARNLFFRRLMLKALLHWNMHLRKAFDVLLQHSQTRLALSSVELVKFSVGETIASATRDIAAGNLCRALERWLHSQTVHLLRRAFLHWFCGYCSDLRNTREREAKARACQVMQRLVENRVLHQAYDRWHHHTIFILHQTNELYSPGRAQIAASHYVTILISNVFHHWQQVLVGRSPDKKGRQSVMVRLALNRSVRLALDVDE